LESNVKSLTRDQQIQNLILAAWRWSEVEPDDVNLQTFGCGSVACFGGHLQHWPEFNDMGIISYDGSPRLADDLGNLGDGYLFGDQTMFNGRDRLWDGPEADDEQLSDYDIVVRRLERRFEELSS
jgi:hypothetical protein